MTEAQLAALVRYKSKTNTTSLTDADLLVLANVYKDEICGEISRQRPEAFNVEDLQTLTADLRTYAFPTSVLNNIIRVELKFSSSSDYVLATGVSQNGIRIALQESVIVTYYDNIDPKYFVRNKFIYILSGAIATLANGVKMVYKKLPADLAAMTDTNEMSTNTLTAPGIPKEFHELLARRISIAFKDRNKKSLSSKELKYERDLQRKIDEFTVPNLDQETIGHLPPASERGNEGFEY